MPEFFPFSRFTVLLPFYEELKPYESTRPVEDNKIILFTSSLEEVVKADLDQPGFGIAPHANLGWGKKETQFQGSRGKEAASLKASAPQDSQAGTNVDIEIAWRDDDQYFVVSWIDPSVNNQRRLRVFNDAGELYSTSEVFDYLESAICWRPRIQLITSTQRRPVRGLDVVFFETNLERHGEFELLDHTLEGFYCASALQFDCHGDVLAVFCSSRSSAHTLRLITCSNYHWSVKRQLVIGNSLPDVDSPMVSFSWASGSALDDLSTFTLGSGTKTGTLLRSWCYSAVYDNCYCLADGLSQNSSDFDVPGYAACVDKNSVCLTALTHAVIPPPMCATRLTFNTCVVSESGQTDTNMPPRFIASVSFPGLWINDKRTSSTVPLLIQFESDYGNVEDSPDLCLVHVDCGAPQVKKQSLEFAGGTVEAEWQGGAQNVAPWPRSVRAISLMTALKTSEDTNLQAALTFAKATHFCGGNELSHFCWLNCHKLFFVACSGYLVGLLDFGDECSSGYSNTTARWLLTIRWRKETTSVPSSVSQGPPVNVCGLCNNSTNLCVGLSNGLVICYDIDQLLASPDCLVIPDQMDQVNPDYSVSDPVISMLRLPGPCAQMGILRVAEIGQKLAVSPSGKMRHVLLALHQSSHRIYGADITNNDSRNPSANQSVVTMTAVMELCSSFLILPQFLLVTSLKKFLICVSTQFNPAALLDSSACIMELACRLSIPSELQSSDSAAPRSWYNDYLHPIETEAVIISASSIDTKVILQMPRGNLEEVHPRALVLTRLSGLLDSLGYYEAMHMMRRHRVNLNLLYDHNPSLFKQNVHQFLTKTDDPEFVTLFVSELVDEDVSETIYGKFYKKNTSTVLPDGAQRSQYNLLRKASKVNEVCALLLRAMKGKKEFLLPTLTCYAKMVPSNLEKALLLLKSLSDLGDQDSWERGVRHLQYFATPVELYRVALGTYDLNLAQIMAQRTQLDPKEYLANLLELRALVKDAEKDSDPKILSRAVAYQRFRIDDQLTRHSMALEHLHDAGPDYFDELISYVKTHRLYGQALEMHTKDSMKLKAIGRAWGERLVSERRLNDAGRVFLRVGLYALAAGVFVSCTHPQLWATAVSQSRMACSCLTCPTEHQDSDQFLSEADITAQARRLADRLYEVGRYEDAIMLHLDYLKEPKTATSVALDGCLWDEARRLAALYQTEDTLNKLLIPKLSEQREFLSDLIEKTHKKFDEHFQRLMALRQKHKEDAEANRLAHLRGDFVSEDAATETDLFSDTSSVSGTSDSGSVDNLSLLSKSTRKSGRSTKSRRKHESRKWSSKPGSKYEEVGLLRELSQSIEAGQRLFDKVECTQNALWQAGLVSEGQHIVKCMNELLTNQKMAIPFIWDEWITERYQGEPVHPYEGRKRYPFKESFISFPPPMKRTELVCYLLRRE
ncbi:unnamed protein product [Calicophoron daubneyi]|uniref:Elongator complex protein 1 n=1 Tax=Calicophoron daubneyi TaxID=300641 RepID=A0AAV2TC10_CALDB